MADWLSEIYALSWQNDEVAADIIFDNIDELFTSARFQCCDEILQAIDVAALSPNLMISFLSITLVAKQKLSSRAALVQQIEAQLDIIDPNRVDILLQGLR